MTSLDDSALQIHRHKHESDLTNPISPPGKTISTPNQPDGNLKRQNPVPVPNPVSTSSRQQSTNQYEEDGHATFTAASSSGDTGSTSASVRGARLMTDTSCDSRRPLAATAAPLHLSLVILAPPRGASGPDPPPSGLATAVPAAATTCAAILDLELVEREGGWLAR